MDTGEFWDLVEQARRQTDDVTDTEAMAEAATGLLAARPVEDIVAAEQVLDRLLAESYRAPLWGAAYMINGGCSDDGFDHFRGWLIMQGREVFERAVGDPEALADLRVVRDAEAEGFDLMCEDALGIVWNAHLSATGHELPAAAPTDGLPELDPAWDFDFDDSDELARRLPRLSALFELEH
ncbi:DUF4240 domain-containing protein [Streptomyces sp. NPDC059009]|uniref:DUF4240 domain-containing protein n=1 Tax=Streptomyces sp. NPDC059009 TaxID=3346694 RepID=UPI00369F9B19